MKSQGGQKIYPLLLNDKDKDVAKASVYRHFDSLLGTIERYEKLDDFGKEQYREFYDCLLKRLRIMNIIIRNLDVIF